MYSAVCINVSIQLSEQLLCQLASDRCPDIKSISLDLMNTLHASDVEP